MAGTIRSVADLTDRQREVLTLMAQGMGEKEIANRLCIAPGTVNSHIDRLYERLPLDRAARPRVAAVVWWLQQGKDGA